MNGQTCAKSRSESGAHALERWLPPPARVTAPDLEEPCNVGVARLSAGGIKHDLTVLKPLLPRLVL